MLLAFLILIVMLRLTYFSLAICSLTSTRLYTSFHHIGFFRFFFFANVFTTCLVRCRHDRARPEGNTDRCVKRQRSILTSSRTAAQNVHLEGMRRARNTTRALALALWLQSATLARTSAGRHAEELETRQRVCAVWLSSKHRHQSDLCRVQEQPVY